MVTIFYGDYTFVRGQTSYFRNNSICGWTECSHCYFSYIPSNTVNRWILRMAQVENIRLLLHGATSHRKEEKHFFPNFNIFPLLTDIFSHMTLFQTAKFIEKKCTKKNVLPPARVGQVDPEKHRTTFFFLRPYGLKNLLHAKLFSC